MSSMNEITNELHQCTKECRALAAINAPGFDAMVGIGYAAAKAERSVIIQVSARLVKQHGAKTIQTWFGAARSITESKCFLHLDHCNDEDLIDECIHAGWDMVMFDGSHLPIEENCKRTRGVVQKAHAAGVAVEAEVGIVGGEEDGHNAVTNLAISGDIIRLGTETGIDCLAVGFGNQHGEYKDTSNLDWDIYESSHELSKLPLVLHGGTGLSVSEFSRAINAGTAKINISTDLKTAYAQVVSTSELHSIMIKNPSTIHTRLEYAAQQLAAYYIDLFDTTSRV